MSDFTKSDATLIGGIISGALSGVAAVLNLMSGWRNRLATAESDIKLVHEKQKSFEEMSEKRYKELRDDVLRSEDKIDRLVDKFLGG